MQWQTGLLAVGLLGIIYEDFKYRAISWYWLPLVFFTSIFSGREAPFYTMIMETLTNIGFALFILALLSLYFSLKERKPINVFSEHLGLGDFLFFLAIAPYFSSLSYILFFTVSLFIVLIITIFVILISANSKQVIPLAGGMSAIFLIVLVIELILGESIIDRQLSKLIF